MCAETTTSSNISEISPYLRRDYESNNSDLPPLDAEISISPAILTETLKLRKTVPRHSKSTVRHGLVAETIKGGLGIVEFLSSSFYLILPPSPSKASGEQWERYPLCSSHWYFTDSEPVP